MNVNPTIRADSCSKESYYETLVEQYFHTDFTSSNLSSYNNGIHRPCPSTYSCICKTLTFDFPTCNMSYDSRSDYSHLLNCSRQALQIVYEEMDKCQFS